MKNIIRGKTHPEWLFGGNPQAIENQEKEGQNQLIASSQLPAYDNFGGDSKKEIEKHGIKVLSLSKTDGLFYDVKLPKGWEINPTDHSMWSDLFDQKKQNVAGIFYKAAFYDRKAFIVFGEKKNTNIPLEI